MPIAPLMLEHRLIERMISAMKDEIVRMEQTGRVTPRFIDLVIDFIRTYADRCHHGKEEDILFALLSQKKMSEPDKKTMDELIQDHRRARSMTARLVAASDRWASDDGGSVDDIISALKELVSFYPGHIEREDRHFFIPIMGYFSVHEQDDLFEAFGEFDRKLVHEKYRSVVEKIAGIE
jgi:hemerythrin-like domain-containing protein